MSSTSKQQDPIRQLMRACHHCNKSESLAGSKLLTCSGCRRAYYCNKECQRSEWSSHKSQCKSNRLAIARLTEEKEKDKLAGQKNTDGPSLATIEKFLAPFVKIHMISIQLAFPQALKLRTQPSNIDGLVLTVNLAPTFTQKPPPSGDPAKSFRLASTRVSTLDEALKPFEADAETIVLLRQRAEEISAWSAEVKAKGDVGVGMVLVRCGLVVHAKTILMPSDILWGYPVHRDWELSLANAMEKGPRL